MKRNSVFKQEIDKAHPVVQDYYRVKLFDPFVSPSHKEMLIRYAEHWNEIKIDKKLIEKAKDLVEEQNKQLIKIYKQRCELLVKLFQYPEK